MCDQCRVFTRRSLLAAAAAVAGLTLAALSCRQQSKKATAPPSQIENQNSKIENPPAPAPDLGSEVFPDPDGNPIAQPSDAPVIILPRTDWTPSHPNLADIAVMNGIHRITVHHTAWQLTTDAWLPTAGELENIREFHSGTRPADRNWADIAYHFVVDRAGRVWQARPLAYQGAHVKNHNEHNLGIVLLGNFEIQSPSAAQLVALASFIAFTRNLYAIPVAQIFTHGELGQTSCPGKNLQAFMNRARKKWAADAGEPPATFPATPSTTSQPTPL